MVFFGYQPSASPEKGGSGFAKSSYQMSLFNELYHLNRNYAPGGSYEQKVSTGTKDNEGDSPDKDKEAAGDGFDAGEDPAGTTTKTPLDNTDQTTHGEKSVVWKKDTTLSFRPRKTIV